MSNRFLDAAHWYEYQGGNVAYDEMDDLATEIGRVVRNYMGQGSCARCEPSFPDSIAKGWVGRAELNNFSYTPRPPPSCTRKCMI